MGLQWRKMQWPIQVFFLFLIGRAVSNAPPVVYKNIEDFELIWDDTGSSAESDVSFWRPKSPSYDYFPVGDVATSSHNKPQTSAVIVKAMEDSALKPPTGFSEIWNDKGSQVKLDVRVFQMNAPSGYTCLGNVAIVGSSTLPDPTKYRCVKTSYVTTGKLSLVWRDRGSGAEKDFSAWSVIRGEDVYSQETGTFLSRASHDMPTETAFLLKSSFVKNDLEVNFNNSNVQLKLYRMSDLELMWKDTGSEGKHDFSCWRVHGSSGAYRLTDIPQGNYDNPGYGLIGKTVDPDHLKAPYSYRKTWSDQGSGAEMNGAIWEPRCPGGFVALGYLCTKGYDQPDVNDMRCVNVTLTKAGTWKWVWNDEGTGSDADCSVYRAIPNDPDEQEVFGMGAVASHGTMSSTAYLLQGNKTTVIDGKPAKKYTLTNVQYNIDDRKIISKEVSNLARLVIENRGTTEQTSTRTLTGSWTETRSWSHTAGVEVGVSLTIETQVPLVAKKSVTMDVRASYSYTTGGSVSKTKSDSVAAQTTVKPKSQKTVFMVGNNYLTDIPYTADIKTEYEDGTFGIRKSVSGVYRGVNVAEMRVIYEADIPL